MNVEESVSDYIKPLLVGPVSFDNTPGPFIHSETPNPHLTASIKSLRDRVINQMDHELQERTRTNPVPTDEEIAMGAFTEMLEPQVREAVLIFNRKGYYTVSSGFYGRNYQTIDGFMYLQESEINALRGVGAIVKVRFNGYAFVSFVPEVADLEVMRQKWNNIAAALPDRGHAVVIDVPSVGTEEFWEKHCRPQDVERVRLERRLAAGDIYPHETREDLEARIAYLKKQ